MLHPADQPHPTRQTTGRTYSRAVRTGDNIAALERGFEVLDCFAATRRPLGNGDVAKLTGLPRATVSRLIQTLVSLGHLRPALDRHDRYELGAGVVRLAQAFLGSIDVRHHARPHVQWLAEASGATALLGVRDGDEMLVVEAGRSRASVVMMGADVGTRMTIATSALGRAWLAGVDAPRRIEVIARWQRTQVRQAAAGRTIEAAVAQALEDGHAQSVGEWHSSINAIAVPIRTASGEVVSLNCGGPAFLMPAESMHKMVPLLMQAAEALARNIGGNVGVHTTPGAS